MRSWAPQWPILFWDLAARTAEQLLAADGPFARFLAMVRVEQDEAERFAQVFEQVLRRLEPVAEQDRMRWRDFLWLATSWVLQRRPEEERDALTAAAVASQNDLALREEATAMSETTKKTWIQAQSERIANELAKDIEQSVSERVEKQSTLRSHREMLRTLLGDAVGELPESLVASIDSCEDIDRLKAAIRKARTPMLCTTWVRP